MFIQSALFTTNLKKQALLAMDYLESLHKSLEKRYEAMRKKAQSDSVQLLPTPPDSPISKTHEADQSMLFIVKQSKFFTKNPPVHQKESTGWISSTELVSLMREKKDALLVFDLRSESSYEKCHIKWDSLINFPACNHLNHR